MSGQTHSHADKPSAKTCEQSKTLYRVKPINFARFVSPAQSSNFAESDRLPRKVKSLKSSKHEQDKSKLAWVTVDTQNSLKRRMDEGRPIQPPPPRLPKKRRRDRDGPTSLRVNRPLRQSNGEPMAVPEDIWLMIFDQMHPRDLLSMRNVCMFFRQRLDRLDTTFHNARISTFGEDSPGPLPGMTEKQLAELTVGRGCMARGCVRSNTAKTYWAYGLRMCTECLNSETIDLPDAKNLMLPSMDEHFLLNLIIAAQFSSGKYQKMQSFNETESVWNMLPTTRTVLLKSDVANVLAEYEKQLETAREAWTTKKQEEATTRRAAITKLETWALTSKDVSPHHRDARRDFFIQKAQELNPPITQEMLARMIPYKNALNSNRPPTAASWDILKPKLLEARPDVEKIFEIESEEYSRNRVDRYNVLARHRLGQSSPEQLIVLELARFILSEMQAIGVADADLVLRVLNGVYDVFEIRTRTDPVYGLGKDAIQAPYKLLLDDALMIVFHVIEPAVGSDNRERSRIALSSFKCPGCPRKDCKTTYKFEELFHHIDQKHACMAGNGEKYFTLRRPFEPRLSVHTFLYYAIEWPRCLPILPLHHDAQRDVKWDPNYRPRYLEAIPTNTVSAFDGRQPLSSGCDGLDFAGNVLHAAQTMHPSTIQREFKTKIALQYGLDRFRQYGSSGQISLESLKLTYRDLSIHSGTSLTFKFRCLSCVRSQSDNKYGRTPQSFHNLVEHFERKHADTHAAGSNWATDLFELPSGAQVRDCILEADENLMAKQESTRKKLAARSKVPRKKPVAKADEILATPTASSLLNKLYTEIELLDPAIATTA
ncbi:MAG: hypothetical protein Q9160_001436 [Pyrenula sp. 1 TL-2023]